jgi:glutathione reductase (NADPH)
VSNFDFDLFVIGGGSGGVRAARMAAAQGVKVGLAEEFRYGGTCVIRGCVPKKLLSYAADFSHVFDDAEGFGWSVGPRTFDWSKLIATKNKEIDRLEGIYGKLLGGAGVQTFDGRAVLTGANSVSVCGKELTAERILVATGGWPTKPDVPGADLAWTSNEALETPELPQRIAVYGGGYIAVEFASIFNGCGAETSLIYRGDKVLRGFDEDVRSFVTDEMAKKGMNMMLFETIEAITKQADGSLLMKLGSGCTQEVDAVMFATGRAPNTSDLGLDVAGVEIDRKGAIKVDEFSQTTQPSIYSVGDVTDRMALTPVAIHEAMAFLDTVYNGKPRGMDYADIPTAVFCHPNVSTVGYSEEQAREKFGEIDVYKSDFRAMKFTLTDNQERSFMKLIVDKASDKVVGAHMVGVYSAEIMQGVGIAIKAGATKAQFDSTVGIHPTSAEEFVTMRTPV